MSRDSKAQPLSPLHIDGDRFVDAHGRQIILRGVNLGGDSKVPYPHGGTQHPSDFSDHKDVTFVGRPFPLEEADAHLSRLQHWGFNCLRLLTTWEAIEHSGPGEYDTTYLDYFEAVCQKAGEYGFYVFVDFHQDVWSRMSGGDGAPGWVFDRLGMDFTRFHAAGAAHVMQSAYDYADPVAHQDAYPSMSWASNYRRPANAILWTLFWGGRRFTPNFVVDCKNVQDFLQDHLLGAMGQVAMRLKDMHHVIGFDSLNEPGVGWFGQVLEAPPMAVGQPVPRPALPGLVWSPLAALAVARGVPTLLPLVGKDPSSGELTVQAIQCVNPSGVSIWQQDRPCPFEQAGIYSVENGTPHALQDGVFQTFDGRLIDIANDAFGPFFAKVADAIRTFNPAWLLFAEIDPLGAMVGRKFPSRMTTSSVNACHWYDVALLVTKQFNVEHSVDLLTGKDIRGREALRDHYTHQLSRIKSLADAFSDRGAPTLIGEFGIPYDLCGASAYAAWGNGERGDGVWHQHTDALSLMYDAMDQLQLSSTQWNYTASNRNDARIGDNWNQEDLSIYSADQRETESTLDSGGRAVAGFCRPFARAVQGRLSCLRFCMEQGTLTAAFDADHRISVPTEIYVPLRHFPNGFDVELSGAVLQTEPGSTSQMLILLASVSGPVKLQLKRRE